MSCQLMCFPTRSALWVVLGSIARVGMAVTTFLLVNSDDIARAEDCIFFFSSRRRHTSLTCDWSSDVCSSDLGPGVPDHGRPPGGTRGGVDPGDLLAGYGEHPERVVVPQVRLRGRREPRQIGQFADRKSVV